MYIYVYMYIYIYIYVYMYIYIYIYISGDSQAGVSGGARLARPGRREGRGHCAAVPGQGHHHVHRVPEEGDIYTYNRCMCTLYVYMYIYTYIHIISICMCVYIYIYIYTYVICIRRAASSPTRPSRASAAPCSRPYHY